MACSGTRCHGTPKERSTPKECRFGGKTRRNGNCELPAPDGLPAQCVGAWAEDKNYFLRKYIDATRSVRAGFIQPKGKGGAAFIDLFAGPGKKRLRETGKVIDGSPLIALQHEASPFSRVIACDIDSENASALGKRLDSFGSRSVVIEGDCNLRIDDAMKEVPFYGLNLALVDPFGLKALKFNSIRRLASARRMDLIIHFPTGDIKRNLVQDGKTAHWLDEALGTETWRDRLQNKTYVKTLVDILTEQLRSLGYSGKQVGAQPIKNNEGVTLYHLVYASKHERGDKIWATILKNQPTGQTSFSLPET